VVNYNTAFRNDQWLHPEHPFHAYIMKYGIPNVSFKGCTREMKRNAINSYLKSQGLKKKNYYTAIGIREDENRRVSKSAGVDNIIYPLVDMEPTDKQDVLDWFSQYDWDLNISEWLGNCLMCYKKSFMKLKAVYRDSPDAYIFTQYMEDTYPFIGPEFERHGITIPRKFFRLGTSTEKMIEAFNMGDDNPEKYIKIMDDAGCSESCEMYEME
ncbi:MAG: hypothetical protein ACWGQW_05845, partial [bacterium]